VTIDLSTKYLGLPLTTPLIAGPGPITDDPANWPALEAAGAGAIVLPSLWEEQISHYDQEAVRLLDYGADAFGEALNYFPAMDDQRSSPDEYLRKVEAAKRAVRVPVIGSLNGVTTGGWVRYAKMIEQAGADALELNVYFLATAIDRSAADVEHQYLDLIAAVRTEVSIPLAIKIGPYFSALPHFANRVAATGAAGLVLFNRFLQPDIHLETLEVSPNLVLSTSPELRLPLRWIAILRPHLGISLGGNSGVHAPADAIKLLLAGADAVIVVSCLLQRGIGHLKVLVEGLRHWLEEQEYVSVTQMKGSLSQAHCPDPAAFERANYMQALRTYTTDI
jgi:dihydroorotate dehydrogenase (fumarate)